MSQDDKLQEAVLAELKWEPSITAAHIGVTANAGVITLTGHVDSFLQKYSAERAAARVKGVRGVAEKIEVQLAFDRKRTDDEIAAAAIDCLGWDVSIPQNEKGWVTLMGEVDWYYEKRSAEQSIRKLFGVVGLSNQIVIKGTIDVSDIKNEIAHALHRTWLFEPEGIEVNAAGGTVVLTGNVHSLRDLETAAAIAWSTPGTRVVQNDLLIV